MRVAEWLSHSTVVQQVPGSNPDTAESVGIIFTFMSLSCVRCVCVFVVSVCIV